MSTHGRTAPTPPPAAPPPPPQNLEQWRLRLAGLLGMPQHARIEHIEAAIAALAANLEGLPELRAALGSPADTTVRAMVEQASGARARHERLLSLFDAVPNPYEELEQLRAEVAVATGKPAHWAVVRAWVRLALAERAAMLRALRYVGIEVRDVGPHLAVVTLAARLPPAKPTGGTDAP